jgi:2-oxoglutarate ferredoxin oxidoreductase subunit alpha
MVRTRQAKINGIVQDIPDLTVDDPADPDGRSARVLVLGWGSTYGPIVAAARRVRKTGRLIAYTHLRHLNPFPANLGDILHRYERVIVPEMNLPAGAAAEPSTWWTFAAGVRGLPSPSANFS